ncbi:hypothetical protein ACLB2K_005068 [Fragaria x ananassa]
MGSCRDTNMIACLCFVVVLLGLMKGETAAEYLVGNSLGCTLPPNTTFYSDWGASKTFHIQSDWKSYCMKQPRNNMTNRSDLIGGISDVIQEIVTIDSAGSRYFVCTVGENGKQGMKMTITVESSTSAPMLLLRP